MKLLTQILEDRKNTIPNKIAYEFLIDGEDQVETITYIDLYERATKMAKLLINNGYTDERALILLPPGIDYIVSFFSCLYANVIAVPCYPLLDSRHAEANQAIVDTSKPKVIIGPLEHQELFEGLAEYIEGKLLFPEEVEKQYSDEIAKKNIKMPEQKPDQIAFLQFTSGSTGNPKGVMVTHANIIGAINGLIHASNNEVSSETIIVAWIPPYHDMGLIASILLIPYLGAKSVLMSPLSFLQKPIRWLRAISKYKATTTGAPNFSLRLCVESIASEECDDINLSSLQHLLCGAEPVKRDVQESFVEEFAPLGFKESMIINGYGMAETTLGISGNESGIIHHNEVISCGRVCVGMNAKIVDPDLKIEKSNSQVGEVWVKGINVAKGYWGMEEKTKEIFEATILDNKDNDKYLRTGDLGFIKENQLYITGRLKDVIIINGLNYYPQDIERTVASTHKNLNEESVAVFSIQSNTSEKIIAAVELSQEYDSDTDLDSLKNSVMGNVLKQHGISLNDLVLLKPKTIPKTTSGKIKRSASKEKYINNELELI